MSLLTEGTEQGLQSSLAQGLIQLSENQSLTFTKYAKQRISQDSSVFWVQTGQTVTAQGSLHYATTQNQEVDQTLGVNAVVFTSMQSVDAFNAIDGNALWIADWQTPSGATIQIAFARQGPFYEQSNLWHYSGFAVYPALASQLVASSTDLPVGPIVSNSLPIWIALPLALQTIPGVFASTAKIYPSYLVAENIEPPYIVADIESTDALQAFPLHNWAGVQPVAGLYTIPDSQLMRDSLNLIFYGFTNEQARQYINALVAYSEYTDAFGFMCRPALRDDKRTQSEIAAIAMKKTLPLRVSYYQSTADAIARRLILSASITYTL